jgi:hypothetical protein
MINIIMWRLGNTIMAGLRLGRLKGRRTSDWDWSLEGEKGYIYAVFEAAELEIALQEGASGMADNLFMKGKPSSEMAPQHWQSANQWNDGKAEGALSGPK